MPVEAVKTGDLNAIRPPATAGRETTDALPAVSPTGRASLAERGGVPAARGEAERRVDRETLEKALRRLHLLTLDTPVRLSFQIHEESGRMMVRVINEETGEVVKEIPPEAILDTVARIMKYVGLLLDRLA